MAQRIFPSTPQAYARTAGVAYLVIIAAGLFAEFFVRSGIIVPGDPASTAANINASETLFRVGLYADIVMIIADAVVAIGLYMLLRSVHEGLALLAAVFRIIQGAVLGANALNQASAVHLLMDTGAGSVFSTDQLQTMALQFMEAHAQGYVIGLAFFAVHCLILGALLLHSGAFPRIFGYLMFLTSLGYMVEGVVVLIFPAYREISMPGLGMALLAELSFCVWLIVKAVPPDHPLEAARAT